MNWWDVAMNYIQDELEGDGDGWSGDDGGDGDGDGIGGGDYGDFVWGEWGNGSGGYSNYAQCEEGIPQ